MVGCLVVLRVTSGGWLAVGFGFACGFGCGFTGVFGLFNLLLVGILCGVDLLG